MNQHTYAIEHDFVTAKLTRWLRTTRKRIIIINDIRNRIREKKGLAMKRNLIFFKIQISMFIYLFFSVLLLFTLNLMATIWFEYPYYVLAFLISLNRFLNQMNSPALWLRSFKSFIFPLFLVAFDVYTAYICYIIISVVFTVVRRTSAFLRWNFSFNFSKLSRYLNNVFTFATGATAGNIFYECLSFECIDICCD